MKTVILSVVRTSGAVERHVLEADGDAIHLPQNVLVDDVVGLDVDVEEREDAGELVARRTTHA
jgi:hypothetical protein